MNQGKNHKIEVPIFKALGLFWSNRPVYMAGMAIGAPAMKLIAGGGDALDAGSAWIPVVGAWTSTRDFDVLSSSRFSTWFKEHKAQQAEGAAAEDAQSKEGGEQ